MFDRKCCVVDLLRVSKSGPVISMPVPSSYNDVTVDKKIRNHVGVVWYDRTFIVPNSWNGQLVWLRFSSVHYSAQVWINGNSFMSHEIGHLPFQDSLSSLLNYGRENLITVAVNNTLTNTTIPQGDVENLPTSNGTTIPLQTYEFDFFNYAGIHRSVHLYTTPSLYVDDIWIKSYISGTNGIVKFSVLCEGLSSTSDVNITVHILNKMEKIVAQKSISIRKISRTNYTYNDKLIIENVNIWWPYLMNKNPGYLYTLKIILETNLPVGFYIKDVYKLKFGIRTIRYNNSSFWINNKPVYFRGFNMHEDSNLRGRGFDNVLITRDYSLLKWFGANVFRTSHYPYSEEMLDFADREGIMVISESPSVNTDIFSSTLLANHKQSLTELINRDKNRPSVIMWSIANEPNSEEEAANAYFRSIVQHVRNLDTVRPITIILSQLYQVDDDQVAGHVDIIGLNRYYAWYKEPGVIEVILPEMTVELNRWYDKYKKPLMMTEFGADTLSGIHKLPDLTWSEEFQIHFLSEYYKSFDHLRKQIPFIGELIWNFADFQTKEGYFRADGNKKGILTRERQPKSAGSFVRKRYYHLAYQIDKYPLPNDLEWYIAPGV